MLTEQHRNELDRLLNEHQVANIMETLNDDEDGNKIGILHFILDTFHSDDNKRDKLIEFLVVPYNMKRLQKETQERINQGSWTVQGIFDAKPPFAYTMGLSRHVPYELIASGVSVNTLTMLLNTLGGILKENPGINTTDINPEKFPLLQLLSGSNGRYRLVDVSGDKTIEEYMCHLPHHVEITPSLTLLALIIPDKNNLLPGEEGYDENFVQLFAE